MANSILEKFENIKFRFDEVAQQITDPQIMTDMKRYIKLNQEYKRLDELVKSFTEYNIARKKAGNWKLPM
jgi:peptide chain release factor 1